ncbi:glycine--tRNA ligase subunit beta [Apilactobacillus micheneri]|uniref:Glycine--tRNA ligase beta subunit n=1 Tax=Apilactobacillus micheneri TaxID=1899430 RepID=A0A9Q8IMG9_9LACO|nr:glycine--tRNA ligase subunit beta [Apilactobacillus micheneri]TPR40698.1 glycine--tRNA ligase subunit beta [Apilactobacillus micheneri]TPR42165.1 glycine--tRNA ligase subunit beta [Apilactobacillus micheneri]TPR44819.1 glycine--tRNA ligase subunit beta [Apilactobacillus micheneri]TPR45119.1 glycine--tRNA ligase subunit beta [Apilactobacillus micheneri]TPR46461.1 glycine--tRNA ligase subunit beta [Apilactobacillus micheneri]
MAHTFLLEVGLEEMPAHVVTPSIKQLVKRTKDYLKDQRIEFDDIKPFSTPRRLTIQITGLADKQEDIDESVKGPAKKIAQDDDGNWSKAAIGFTKGQGATTDDITFKEVKGTEYVFVEKHIDGKPVSEVLMGMKDVITSMTFPTLMKWNVYDLEFIRPIRWMVALLDDKVLPIKILDVTAGNVSRGHRFLGQYTTIESADNYEKALHDQFVIVDADKRKKLIKDQIEQISKDNNWVVNINPSLLEEVNNLVEWPTAFYGNFDKKYLELPADVLITSMRDNQRFFYVQDQDKNILPYFISVRNGNKDYLENVAVGNEKVLTARLEDAMFFYKEDQSNDIDFYVNKLKKVSFHDKISTMYEKMQRVEVITQVLGKHVGLSDTELSDVKRAAQIYKFDLVTGMVGEFSELQGIMGEKYALLKGENKSVATAIREHYMPISANSDLPATKVGAVLAVADKFDSILTFFAAGMIPSGSNDPYALRRQANGIVRIVNNQKWNFNLENMMNSFIKSENEHEVAPSLDQTKEFNDIVGFINDRIIKVLKDDKLRHDIIDAISETKNHNILFIFEVANVLNQHKDDDEFKKSIEALTRVLRISNKQSFNNDDLNIDESLFENDSEKKLYEKVSTISENYYQLGANAEFNKLMSLKDVINDYFDETMVMAKDDNIKNNHLRQMTIIANMINWFADLDKLIVK